MNIPPPKQMHRLAGYERCPYAVSMDFQQPIKRLALMATLFCIGHHAHANPLSSAEKNICENIQHCLKISRDHAADSFDYHVLAQDFGRFGEEGRKALLKAMTQNQKEVAERAKLLLSYGNFRFTPAEQHGIADQWRKTKSHNLSDLMIKYYSPLMRKAVITTLSDNNSGIRETSRYILKHGEVSLSNRMGASKTASFRADASLYPVIVKAVLSEPTEELVSFVEAYPSPKSTPILTRLLKSNEEGVVTKSYAALYTENPEKAFNALLERLQNLSNDEPKNALALSGLLQKRHNERADGFYLKFARDMATDKAFPPLARMVGVNAIMGADGSIPLPSDALAIAGLTNAISAQNTVPLYYFDALDKKLNGSSQVALPILWSAVNRPGHPNKAAFIESLGKFEITPDIIDILISALGDMSDWEVTSNAAKVLGLQKVPAAKPKLAFISKNHPILMARVSALAALDTIEGAPFKIRKNYWENALLAQAPQCDVKPLNFNDGAQQLPYFDETKMAYGYTTVRGFLTSAVATKTGWLAGYDYGEFSGGLVTYDNQTGIGNLLHGQPYRNQADVEYIIPNISAVMPKREMPLGQYASAFWAFTQMLHFTDQGGVLSVMETAEGWDVKQHSKLPAPAKAIQRLADNSLLIGFGDKPNAKIASDYQKKNYHPPLRLLPNGGIMNGCTSPVKAPLEAMP